MRRTPFRPSWLRLLGAALMAMAGAGGAAAQEPLHLRVVGGLGGVSQYTRHEEPFWRDRVPELLRGRVTTEIVPSDRSGLKPEDMLSLIQRGTVPFGTILLAQAAAEEPEFQALDLPLQNPDITTLRRTVQLYRPHLQRLLAERYGIELLAVYTYPAQVVWCRQPFSGLSDLANRRIRISSLGQGEVFEALGATPVSVPFNGIVQAMRDGAVECAVTGALSGNAIGLQNVATHIQDMALSWGVSIFVANRAAWNALPEDVRARLREGLSGLEAAVWAGVEGETVDGMRCATGGAGCTGATGRLTAVPMTPGEAALRRGLLNWTVLPRWIDRCGPDCADVWNGSLAAGSGIQAHAR
ncbi:TRAP transporter substrate-binding protein [Roseomonas populi]|uniref:TRAP transporter substrate-binding protein n=1 Tax=Roseomonas populi TaxID=3121582 RepID=A0ABT1X4K1_9PROT|nr:TRAP transporter substrate-binding protein [Roseomonas pecuniae]MCR0983032.1 TRAP transporter substrate-binding protein [Roseomonas pecuniae]